MTKINLKKDATQKTYHRMKPEHITVEEGFNIREDTQELRDYLVWLKDSIRTHGVRKPITVVKKGDDYVLTDGHQRHAMASELVTEGEDIRIPVIIEDHKTTTEVERTTALAVDNTSLHLSIPEQVTIVKRFMALGLTPAEVAVKISKSVGHVNHLLKYEALPEEVQQMVVDGKISPSAAIKTSFEEGPEEVTKVLKVAEDLATENGDAKVTKKHIDKARDQRYEDAAKPSERKTITIRKAPVPVTSVGIFSAVYKYAETLIGMDDDLANEIVDTCQGLELAIAKHIALTTPTPPTPEED